MWDVASIASRRSRPTTTGAQHETVPHFDDCLFDRASNGPDSVSRRRRRRRRSANRVKPTATISYSYPYSYSDPSSMRARDAMGLLLKDGIVSHPLSPEIIRKLLRLVLGLASGASLGLIGSAGAPAGAMAQAGAGYSFAPIDVAWNPPTSRTLEAARRLDQAATGDVLAVSYNLRTEDPRQRVKHHGAELYGAPGSQLASWTVYDARLRGFSYRHSESPTASFVESLDQRLGRPRLSLSRRRIWVSIKKGF